MKPACEPSNAEACVKLIPSTVQRVVRSRNGALLVDTGLSALMGIVVVVLAARSLGAGQLDRFSVAQLLVVTVVGIVRASIYGPAMAAQRTTGRAVIPARWIVTVSVPVAAGIALSFGPVVNSGGGALVPWILCLFVTCTIALMLDATRSALLSRELVAGAIVADACALVFLGSLFALGFFHGSEFRTLYGWAVALFGALLIAIGYLLAKKRGGEDVQQQSLRETWKLGRWAALDSSLAAVGSLLPIFVAALVVGGGSAGVYRTLQTALGPLNIIHTTVITSFSLDAWQAADTHGLQRLGRRVRRLTLVMIGMSGLYVGAGLPVMGWVAGLHDPDLGRIMIVVGIAAVMGAATTAPNAGALALGYHKAGALIRGTVLVLSVVISLPQSVHTWVPWSDAIGTTMFMSALLALAGWTVAYRRAMSVVTRPA